MGLVSSWELTSDLINSGNGSDPFDLDSSDPIEPSPSFEKLGDFYGVVNKSPGTINGAGSFVNPLRSFSVSCRMYIAEGDFNYNSLSDFILYLNGDISADGLVISASTFRFVGAGISLDDIEKGKWFSVAGYLDQDLGASALYIDGELKASTTPALDSDLTGIFVNYIVSSIDEISIGISNFRLYDSPIDEEQIQYDMTYDVNGIKYGEKPDPPDPPGPVVYTKNTMQDDRYYGYLGGGLSGEDYQPTAMDLFNEKFNGQVIENGGLGKTLIDNWGEPGDTAVEAEMRKYEAQPGETIQDARRRFYASQNQ